MTVFLLGYARNQSRCGGKQKKPFLPHSERKAVSTTMLTLILLLCGEVLPRTPGYEHALADVLTSGLTPTLPPSRRPMDCVVSGSGISLPVTVALPFPIFTGFPVNPR